MTREPNHRDRLPGIETAAQRATLPFQIVEELGVPCGYERSFKMLDNRLFANRYLLGVETKHLTRDRMLDVCGKLNMPQAYADSLAEHFAEANLVFLGFEDNETGCIYKVYLEFWDKVRKDIQSKRDKMEPVMLHLGFKWNTNDNTHRAVARYACYPLLSVSGMLQRLTNIYQGHEDKTSLRVAKEIVEFAANRAGERSFIYLEVSEGKSPRISFDINLYRANIRLKEIHASLWELRGHFSISADRFGRLYELAGDKLLGHLSGGVNREGEDFFTVYYEM